MLVVIALPRALSFSLITHSLVRRHRWLLLVALVHRLSAQTARLTRQASPRRGRASAGDRRTSARAPRASRTRRAHGRRCARRRGRSVHATRARWWPLT